MVGVGVAAGVVLAAMPLWASAPALAATPGHAKVVVVAVPALSWADVESMPRLRQWAAGAAAGQLSVRTQGVQTRCADGSLAVSAGTRVVSGTVACAPDATTMARLRQRDRDSRFGAVDGALGEALRAAGVTTAAVGAAAVPLIGDRHGVVDRMAADLRAGLAAADVVAVLDEGLYAGQSPAQVDTTIAAQLSQVPATATVVVAGTSDSARGGAHLRFVAVRGPGWPHRALTSATTHRSSYVQLIDLGPTVLSIEQVPVPSVMAGRPMAVSGEPVRSVASYVDDDRHARLARVAGHATMTTLCVLVGLLVLLALWRPEAARWPARLLLLAPVFTWLVQLLPWWRWGLPAYAGMVVAASVVAGLAIGRAALPVAPALTGAVLVADQLAGSPLQLSAPLGDNPLVAGRFHGMGNLAFAVMCSSLVLLAGWLAGLSGSRRAAITVVALIGLLAIVVDGAPMLGDDFGGVLALTPAVAVLLALVAGVRLSWRRLVLLAVLVAGLAVAVALIDYSRPPADQTHIGRFVGQVLHGGAARVVTRKLHAVATSIGNVGVTGLVLVVAASLWVTRRAGRPAGGPHEHARCLAHRMEPAVVALVVLAVLGSLLNDSGIYVAAGVALASVPALVAAPHGG